MGLVHFSVWGLRVPKTPQSADVWRSEGRKGSVDPGGVTGGRPHQNIEILRGAGVSVKGNGVPPNDDKLGAGVVKLHQKVAKVFR
jgi:hypothetical protein